MALKGFYLEVTGLDAMEEPFKKMTPGPTWHDTAVLEKNFTAAFVAVLDGVHEMTGKLKSSGMPNTGFDGDTWWGEMEFAGNPGIFELARGKTPTGNHPEGEHFFFERVEPFIPGFGKAVDSYFQRAFNENAPI